VLTAALGPNTYAERPSALRYSRSVRLLVSIEVWADSVPDRSGAAPALLGSSSSGRNRRGHGVDSWAVWTGRMRHPVAALAPLGSPVGFPRSPFRSPMLACKVSTGQNARTTRPI